MIENLNIHFAPLQGYADHLYRRFHAEVYGPTDAYYTPFIRMEKGDGRRQDLSRLEVSRGDGTHLIPQVIFNSVDEFQTLVSSIKRLGYTEIDLNLGCPYPMQTRKGRGASMISRIDVMKKVAEIVNSDTGVTYSVKMRLGLESPDEWRVLLPVLNDMRLQHITLHPRVATQMYGGPLYADAFEQMHQQSTNPMIWNGDVLTPADIDLIATQHPGIKGIMIGRGLLARPSLHAEWLSGNEWSAEERLAHILDFHRLLFEAYETSLCGQTQILNKIKPFWEYLEPEIGHKAIKAINKAVNLSKYRTAIDNISL